MSKPKIIEVQSRRDLNRFIGLPFRLYRGNPCFVPELRTSTRHMLGPGNPFFRHSEAVSFMAVDGDMVLGRITAIRNNAHLQTYNDGRGFFGFFECVNDDDVAAVLFDAAGQWLKARSLEKVTGPTNLTTNDSMGILTSGFDLRPFVLMPFNPPYYGKLLKTCGFSPEIEMFAYSVDHQSLVKRLSGLMPRVEGYLERMRIKIRSIDFSNFEEEIERLRPAYNRANEGNWGFQPMNREEFGALAAQLKQIVPPDLVQLAEHEGRIIGFVVAVPDLNQILHKIRDGRLFPCGIIKLLAGQKGIDSLRVLILGVVPEFQHHGIDAALFSRLQQKAERRGLMQVEAGYVLANNAPMNSILRKIGAKPLKTYSIFSKDI